MTLMLSTRGTCTFTSYPGLVLKKYLIENVENTISQPLDFKIFLGRIPQTPSPPLPPAPLPYKILLSTVIASFLYRE